MKVLITREIPQAGVALLTQYPQLEVDMRKGPPLSNDEYKEAIKGVSALIPVIPDKVTKEIIEAGGDCLKIVAAYSVGYDHIDVVTATERGIYVTNTPGNFVTVIAEHAFGLMLATGRRVSEADRYVREGEFEYWDPMSFLGTTFERKTLGIVGFGRIGQAFAKMAKLGLGMEILYHDVQRVEEAEKQLGTQYTSLQDLLKTSDVVSLHCNLTEATYHLIGEAELNLMKPTAYLINTARGAVIDEEALVIALEKGEIAGAGLDVFENEPAVNPQLLKLKNTVLTPHIGSATHDARESMATIAAQNVIDVLIKNAVPTNLVNEDKTNSLVLKAKEKMRTECTREY